MEITKMEVIYVFAEQNEKQNWRSAEELPSAHLIQKHEGLRN